MQLHEHGEGAVVGAADDVHLPGRQPAFEGLLHQLAGEPGGPRHEPAARLIHLALGQPHSLDVPVHVEVLVDGPGGTAHRQQNVPYPHPQPGDRGRAGAEQLEDRLRVDTGRGGGGRREDGERAEVHRVRIGFEMPERQIERCQ